MKSTVMISSLICNILIRCFCFAEKSDYFVPLRDTPLSKSRIKIYLP